MNARLTRSEIESRIPHRGAMCLLESLLECDAGQIRCLATSHTDPAHPLRMAHGLPAAVALEIASQAMALHGALNAPAGAPARAGFLASARDLRLHAAWLDNAPGPLVVQATRLAGDTQQALYRFALHDADGRALAEGRAVVILDGQPAAAR